MTDKEEILKDYFNCKRPFKKNGKLSKNGEKVYARLVSLLQDMTNFMGDFLRALNEIDNKKSKEDKIREYILSRNIQYDLVGEDILKILDEEE